MVIINVTQCIQGKVAAHYAAGSAMVKAGCVPGSDMTVEAALTKLVFLLAQPDLQGPENIEKVRKMAGSSLRGEMSEDRGTKMTWKDNSFVESVASALKTSSNQDMKAITESLSPVLLCNFASQGDIKAIQNWVLLHLLRLFRLCHCHSLHLARLFVALYFTFFCLPEHSNHGFVFHTFLPA